MARRGQAGARRGGGVRRVVTWLFLIALLGPPLLVLVYRFVPPPVTILMLQRAGEDGIARDWRSLDDLDADLVHAAVAAEDSNFCAHNGFDVAAIKKAMKNNERRPNRIRGGSTISQQTAKNVFLWPGRSWGRKGLEAGYTGLIELFWGKRRIMEVYLNVAEWAPGVYGAQAASRRWFRKDADELTAAEASRLAAILPSPRRYRADSGRYVRRRAGRIGAALGTVRGEGLADCVIETGRDA